jgi:predicted lysophospholipase L1 biosynthesis ABC-type transport system permease subunit
MTPASTAVVVSEALANRSWPGQDPLGKRVAFGGPVLTVVGVVGEVKYRRLPVSPDADPDFYLPFLDRNSQVAIAVRTVLPPASIAASIRAAVRAADPSIAVFGVTPMNELIGTQTAPYRFVMWLMGVFATVALSLAMIGIYGVMSYLVAQRTREIGIRVALGAERHAVMGLILRRSAALTGIGLGAGLASAFAVARFLGVMLFGVAPFDPATFIAVALLFGLVALAASSVPALRATRIDPLVALRAE